MVGAWTNDVQTAHRGLLREPLGPDSRLTFLADGLNYAQWNPHRIRHAAIANLLHFKPVSFHDPIIASSRLHRSRSPTDVARVQPNGKSETSVRFQGTTGFGFRDNFLAA